MIVAATTDIIRHLFDVKSSMTVHPNAWYKICAVVTVLPLLRGANFLV